jgi:hypothetical protein
VRSKFGPLISRMSQDMGTLDEGSLSTEKRRTLGEGSERRFKKRDNGQSTPDRLGKLDLGLDQTKAAGDGG